MTPAKFKYHLICISKMAARPFLTNRRKRSNVTIIRQILTNFFLKTIRLITLCTLVNFENPLIEYTRWPPNQI